jgi:hypothetical protein
MATHSNIISGRVEAAFEMVWDYKANVIAWSYFSFYLHNRLKDNFARLIGRHLYMS